jgi:hypothetical protein
MNKEKQYKIGDLLQTRDIHNRNVYGTIIDVYVDAVLDSAYITVAFLYSTRQATVVYLKNDLDFHINHGHTKHHPGNIEI